MKPWKVVSAPVAQTEQAKPEQVKNNAGGYVFAIDCFTQLKRYLILGSEGGTYYASEKKLTLDNFDTLKTCIKKDFDRTISLIEEVVINNLAPKPDPVIFAWCYIIKNGTLEQKQRASLLANKILSMSTKMFHAADAINDMGGWGRLTKRIFANWYLSKSPDQIAYQVTKYQQRDGWAHKDILNLAHPNPSKLEKDGELISKIFRYVTYGDVIPEVPMIIGFEMAKKAENAKQIIRLINEFGLVREHIPTNFLNDIEVWRALLTKMPYTALIRNLGKMSSMDMTKPLSKDVNQIIEKIGKVKGTGTHPFAILLALMTYKNGHGDKGGLSWTVNPNIVDALESAFELAFQEVVPSNKRFYLALDVSGSMGWSTIAGMPITPAQGSAAMALITARTEPYCHVAGFSTSLVPISVTKKTSLSSLTADIAMITMGGTDCAAPMLDAIKKNLEVDTFVVYTDNETWFGNVHPYKALEMYRKHSGINAKLIVCGMSASKFSIADPKDIGMLDVVGFSSDTPAIISEFSAGNI